MVNYRRARTPEQKDERRQQILDCAGSRFHRSNYDRLTMTEIATQAGLSKGTLYLYFESKEELFFAVLLQGYQEWFAELIGIEPLDLVEVVVQSLQQRPRLLELMSLAPLVLERNASPQVVLDFKRKLAALLQQLSTATGLPPERLIWLHAAIVGLFLSTTCPAPLKEAMSQDPDLQIFTLDFSQQLGPLLRTLIPS